MQNDRSMRIQPMYDTSRLKHFGEDSFIDEHVLIRRPRLVEIGNHTNIDWGVYITTSANIGDYVHIAPYVTIIGGENATFIAGHFSTIAIGSRVVCVSDGHSGDGLVGPTIPEPYKDRQMGSHIELGKFANVGSNVVLMPDVILPEGVVIGSLSFVRLKDKLEPWTIYAGNPLKKIRERPREKMLRFAKELGY